MKRLVLCLALSALLPGRSFGQAPSGPTSLGKVRVNGVELSYLDQGKAKVWEPATRGLREGDEAGVKAAADGFGELGYSGSDEKMTFATLPPEVQSVLIANAAEWRALTQSKEAFPDLAFGVVQRTTTPTLLLSGGRSLALHGMIDRQLATLLPHSERIVLANATHEMWNEQPEACREAAFAFLAKH